MLTRLGPGRLLCRLDSIEDGGCTELRCGEAEEDLRVIVVRKAGMAWAYINRCPHFSLPLNAVPNRFLTFPPHRLMCAYHCAVFRFEDGVCIEGPAQGMRLDAIPVTVVGGDVIAA
jgi:nitrite reductase/ring-hydroxylating ferredoxin subunit